MAEEQSPGKPAEFFIGLVDFFAILLPGAILAFWVYRCLEHNGVHPKEDWLQTDDKWLTFAAFAISAYVTGHLVHAIGSQSLDPFYDLWKNSFKPKDWGELKGHADSRMGNEWPPPAKLSGSPKEQERPPDDAPAKSSGTYAHEIEAYLRVWSAAATTELERLEADQKFFRGLIVSALFVWPSFILAWEHEMIKGGCVSLALVVLLFAPHISKEGKWLFWGILVTFFLWLLVPPWFPWPLEPNRWLVPGLLLFSTLLSGFRFFQQRMKFTKFLYRAYLALRLDPPPSFFKFTKS